MPSSTLDSLKRRDVLIISLGVEKLDPLECRAPHTKHLNQVMVVVGEPTIVHQV